MLIILLFSVLLVVKLAALALVYSTPPVVPLLAIAILIAAAYRIDAIAAKRARPAPRSPVSD